MQSDVPYELGDKIFIRGRSNSWELQTKADVELANHAYAEGRKAAENYTEKMLVFAKDEVIKCHEEIRRLEDKYARNVFKMPSDGGFHWTPTTNVQFEKLTKDLKELLETTEYVVDRIGDSGPFGQMHALEKFRAWKKARGIK